MRQNNKFHCVHKSHHITCQNNSSSIKSNVKASISKRKEGKVGEEKADVQRPKPNLPERRKVDRRTRRQTHTSCQNY